MGIKLVDYKSLTLQPGKVLENIKGVFLMINLPSGFTSWLNLDPGEYHEVQQAVENAVNDSGNLVSITAYDPNSGLMHYGALGSGIATVNVRVMGYGQLKDLVTKKVSNKDVPLHQTRTMIDLIRRRVFTDNEKIAVAVLKQTIPLKEHFWVKVVEKESDWQQIALDCVEPVISQSSRSSS